MYSNINTVVVTVHSVCRIKHAHSIETNCQDDLSNMKPLDLRPYLSSSRIQMAALGHTSTPFCFIIRQILDFFPRQVQLLEVPFDDIYPVLPWSSWLSLVTSQFPVCCLTSFSRVVHSQNVSQPPEPSFFNYIFQFPWTSFISDVTEWLTNMWSNGPVLSCATYLCNSLRHIVVAYIWCSQA